MAVARGLIRQKLCAAPIIAVRHAPAFAPLGARFASSSPGPKRLRPSDADNFYNDRTGDLMTTPENKAWFEKYPSIHHDNGIASPLRMNNEEKGVMIDYRVTLRFTPKHLIHPYQLGFLDPKGHPKALAQRLRYAEKTLKEPLWIVCTGYGQVIPVVKSMAKRRVHAAICAALQRRGYDAHGKKADGKHIRGTLWLTLKEPLRTVDRRNLDEFGERAVDMLLRGLDQGSQQRSMPTHQRKPAPKQRKTQNRKTQDPFEMKFGHARRDH
ncbi:uncharacterized protein F5Z01DRAFT_643882 [Emericellopsis atlantica]|uniref:Uncharacterized protein n=1 Tax=Emericellopsis atlantica TaxID=2614577 RepID=A0A9P8CWR0_9HYPO|nr:uncharacterized protein F5Z01DRAFT_643882 [Emericellopsis atlantica]KAG9258676.1 hypothetical protein F5Z01DRAFT_643882 [Emericellopsis atlantica]